MKKGDEIWIRATITDEHDGDFHFRLAPVGNFARMEGYCRGQHEGVNYLLGKREDLSDGHHTFKELYEHRHVLFAVICSIAAACWKSKLHSDGTMFDGWFIAGLETLEGVVTYHLPLEWWGEFPAIEVDRAPEWDGHTSQDVVKRLRSLL